MRVCDHRLLQVLLNSRPSAAIGGDQFDLDARAVLVDGNASAFDVAPVYSGLVHDIRLVVLGIDAKLDSVGRTALSSLARDDHRFPRRELPVETGGTDSDSLLPARLLEPVKLRSVEELREDLRHLRLDDARTVVLDNHAEAPCGRRTRGLSGNCGRHLPNLDENVGQDSRLLTRIERVVDGLLDRGEERLGRIVETQEMPILRKELADRDFALARRHRFGGRASPRRRCLLGGRSLRFRGIGWIWHGARTNG